jgi:DNA invertase Pin-like site-specific DNA recombinase
MEHKSFAYARVSSRDQNLARQLESLKQYVPDDRDIFVDKQSGKNTDRPGLQLLLHLLRSGDTLYLHSLDRLGRNKEDIKNILRELKEKKVFVRILDLPTSMVTTNDEVTGATMEMVNNLLIEVLGYVAEMERRNIRKRQEEGIEIAKEKGVKFGRKKLPWPETWEEDYIQWKNKKCTAMSLIKKYGWNSTSFYRKVQEWETDINNKYQGKQSKV